MVLLLVQAANAAEESSRSCGSYDLRISLPRPAYAQRKIDAAHPSLAPTADRAAVH
jgi:hypothetical protein